MLFSFKVFGPKKKFFKVSAQQTLKFQVPKINDTQRRPTLLYIITCSCSISFKSCCCIVSNLGTISCTQIKRSNYKIQNITNYLFTLKWRFRIFVLQHRVKYIFNFEFKLKWPSSNLSENQQSFQRRFSEMEYTGKHYMLIWKVESVNLP